ncbi:MAG: TonB-dependent receptor [Gemmatimonadaceae bacterium]|nr:TonB-dependent receptor [Gemmatimonadaceae bacterium]
MTRPSRLATRALQVAASAIVCGTAAAQASPCPVLARDSARVWTPPLDRVVTLNSSGGSLRTALDLVAARAGVRLSYSSESLPLDREACVPQGPMPLGAALSALLNDLNVTPTTSGGRQVVLAPTRPAAAPVAARTATLDRVVVTGSAAGSAQRSLPYALDVVQGRDLRGGAAPTLATALNGSIPGLWIWSDAPTTLLTRFGSVRGASSFGLSAPKVFVDGIELANPLLLARISADAIDRIEVIRGPQGAALYGADAISGVVNVQLRHDGAADGHRDANIRSSAGASQSDYTSGGVFTQEHTVSLRAGSGEKSAGAVMALMTTGAVVPGGSTLQYSVDAGARRVMARTILASTARLWVARADSPVNPVLAAIRSSVPGASPLTPAAQQAVSQYTLGTTMTHAPDAAWTHTVTVGVDGYRLSGLSVDYVPVPSSLDSALRSTQGGADKGTLRATSVRRVGIGDANSATLTFAGDASLLRDATTSSEPWASATPPGGQQPAMFRPSLDSTRWLSTAGVGLQAALNLRETVFLTAGLRGERNDGFTEASRFALLPALGASVVRTNGGLTWKARVAYGAGVRPARNPMRETAWRGIGSGAVGSDLLPERQAGIEAGIDMYWRRNLSVQVTRFDQRASSLIQQVPVLDDSAGGAPDALPGRGGAYRQPHYRYTLANLGAITNRGWELSVRESVGALSISGSFSLVDSRVDQVAPGYAGDLRDGDRVLAVPARTTGLALTWTPPRWQFQLGGTQVADWVNYDRLSLASTYMRGGTPSRGLTGATLRSYWMQYPEVTRLRASVAHDLTRSLSLRFIGDNLLDRQRGEPDNVTIVPGRTLSFGIAARF